MILEQIARDTEIRVTNQKKKVPLGTLEKSRIQHGDRDRISF